MKEKSKKIILLLIAVIVFLESLHYLQIVKLIDSNFLMENYKDFINANMISYFLNIITFVIFAIYIYFIKKINLNLKLSKLVFTVLILGNILYKITIYKDNTIFYYLSLIFQVILVLYLDTR